MKQKEQTGRKDSLDPFSIRARLRNVNKMNLHFVLPLVLFYFVVGLLLILLNDLVTNVAAWALAVALVLVGGCLIWRYIRSGLEYRIEGVDLAVGLILALAGILLIISPADMKEVFPKIWGLSLIFGGFLKIQYAFDEKSVNIRSWWIMLVFAAVSLAIGVLALLNKAVFGDSQNLVIGIFLLCEAALDLVTYFLITRGLKKKNAPEPAPAAPGVPDVPAPAPQDGPSAES
ncbi:MAG: DUF308 domain-containing protein [Clostridia bacterium]|nr:DUF308 domain-containing protein [Clostridia bacterium]